jgi:hypothetical protein
MLAAVADVMAAARDGRADPRLDVDGPPPSTAPVRQRPQGAPAFDNDDDELPARGRVRKRPPREL